MKKVLMILFCCVCLFADWEGDVSSIKSNVAGMAIDMQNFDSWRENTLENVLFGISHVMLYGYDYSLTAGGDYREFFWPDNYESFWPQSNNVNYEDNSKMYTDEIINLGGIPRNWGSYPLSPNTADYFIKLGSFSDLVNNVADDMNNGENSYGINQLENTETIQKVEQVTDTLVNEFHDAISNVDDYLFILDFTSIGEFYVNVCSSLGITVQNPFSGFQYKVSLIPDEVNNPYLFKLYTYWPLKEGGSFRFVFAVCIDVACFIFMLNKVKEMLSGEFS